MVEPLMTLFVPPNVWLPVLAVKEAALLVRPPLKVMAVAAVSFQVPPLSMMTRPVKVLLPVALLNANVPPLCIVVVPVTPKVALPIVKVPVATVKVPRKV